MNLLVIFFIALRLGLTSFGGPIAHIGFFRDEYVGRRKWISDRSFSELVALSQLLPGPASSQLGIAIGTLKGGRIGGFLAWLGFTTPSAIVLIAFAYGMTEIEMFKNSSWLHGLKLVVVPVVGFAVWGMASSIWIDRKRQIIGVLAAVAVLFVPGVLSQLVLIFMGALAGMLFLQKQSLEQVNSDAIFSRSPSKRSALVALVIFILGLVFLPVLYRITGSQQIDLFENFYRTGSLVFGGGHVVLPLLHSETVGSGYVNNDQFIAGYGISQAIPGPLFTFASFLGASAQGTFDQRWIGGLVTLVAIFVPSFLLVWSVLPFWSTLSRNYRVYGAVNGVNVVVVGVLLSALYDPIWNTSVSNGRDFAIVAALFGMLAFLKLPPWIVVISGVLAGWATGLI